MTAPYYQDDAVTIWHAPMAEVVGSIGEFDCAIVDPPYGETSLEWDRWPFCWPSFLVDVTVSMWCFGSMRMFLERADDFKLWNLSQDIVWRKHNGSGFAADRFRRIHEHALHWYLGAWESVYVDPVFTADATARQVRRKQRPAHTGHIDGSSYESEDGGPRLQRSVIDVRSCHGYAVHPTQKPEGIVEPLISYSCPPGGIVLDPFMGSGTTLVVAKATGRRAVGIEVDERFCEAAATRCQSVLAFGGAA